MPQRMPVHRALPAVAGLFGQTGGRVGVHDLGDLDVQPLAVQDRAADVAVGDGAHQMARVVDHERDLHGTPVQGLPRIAHAGLGADDDVTPVFAHRWFASRRPERRWAASRA